MCRTLSPCPGYLTVSIPCSLYITSVIFGMQLEELLAAELGEREYDTDSQGMRQEVAAFALGEGEPRVWGVHCRPSCVLAVSAPGLDKKILQQLSNGCRTAVEGTPSFFTPCVEQGDDGVHMPDGRLLFTC